MEKENIHFVHNNLFVCKIYSQKDNKELVNIWDIQSVKYDFNDKIIVVEFKHNLRNNNILSELYKNLYSFWFWKNINKNKYKIEIDNVEQCGTSIYKTIFNKCKLTKIITPKLDYTHKTVFIYKCVFKFSDFNITTNFKSEVQTIKPTLKDRNKALLILKAQNEMLEDAKQTVIKKNNGDKDEVCEIIDNAIKENIQTAKIELNSNEKEIKSVKYKKKNKKKTIV